jgi:glucose-1-phosphate adenylyltransferase
MGDGVEMGMGDNVPNFEKPRIYNTGISVMGENSSVPDNVKIGMNCVISGKTTPEDYPNNELESGKTITKEVSGSGVKE